MQGAKTMGACHLEALGMKISGTSEKTVPSYGSLVREICIFSGTSRLVNVGEILKF